MSGEYRSPYKSETVFVTLLIGIAVAAGTALFLILMKVTSNSKAAGDSGTMFIAIASTVALAIFIAILVAIFGVGVRSVKKGFLCKYSANDETFTTTVGGDLHVIQYKDVTSIQFQPRMSFGKIRGYDVTIRVSGKDECFSICSDGYLSQRSTPFYIIQERLDLIRHPRSAAQMNSSSADTKAITRAEIDRAKTGSVSAMDRMAQLLGETSNMPELSADTSPVKKALAETDKMTNVYSSDRMPSIGQTVKQSHETYFDTYGREHDIMDIQAQGVFYVKADPKITALLTVLGMAAGGALIFLAWNLLWFIKGLLVSKEAGDIVGIVLVILAQPFIVYHMLTHIRGKLHTYKADGRGFFVSAKDKGDDTILYKDVLSVDYTPTKLLWMINGFKVDILTTYGLIHYDYIFPRISHKIARQNLPFEVIRKNIPNREK